MTDRTPDPVDRLNAALEGRYRIERELGAGGMATVYLAEDLRHDRQVAIKVLRPELAAVVGGERFLTEIKTTANLQHPHILPLFDSGEADSFLFYVMPYVPGDSLRERLDREKQLPVAEALSIMRKVADAVDYAHEHGVVHRDIKPANILLSERGEPLVADFGIALAVAQAGGGRITETGLSLGTPYYMSPEQATGDRDVNPRSDVYALGCVLFEMLAGEPPFAAPTAQAVLAKILTSDAPLITAVRRTVPPHVESALAQALEKLPADRFGSAAEFSEALEDEGFSYLRKVRTAPIATAPVQVVAAPAPPRGPGRGVVVATAAVALVATLLALWSWTRPTPTPRVQRATLHVGELLPRLDAPIRVSRDGSTFVMSASPGGGSNLLWVRRTDESDFRPLPGTESARNPDFSPDGQWIVYRDEREEALRKVSVSGGAPLTVLQQSGFNPFYPMWGLDGFIYFLTPDGVFRVPETGGIPEQALLQGAQHPRALPEGKGVLFTYQASVAVQEPGSDTHRMLVQEGLDATYVPSGHIIYAHPEGGLMAVGFDLDRMEVTSQPVPLLDGIGNRGLPGADYSVSEEGTLTYLVGRSVVGNAGADQLLWASPVGDSLEVLSLEPREFGEPRISPDGRYMAYASPGEANNRMQIFVYDLELGSTPRQITFEGLSETPVWSPDGDRIAFSSMRAGSDNRDLFVKTVNDDSAPVQVAKLPGDQTPWDWPEDDQLVFVDNEGFDIWIVDPSGSADPEPYLQSEAALSDPVVSPDGTHLAYESNEGGSRAIYVRSFPEPRQQTRVSQGPGRTPFWAPDGSGVYYWGTAGGVDTLFIARTRAEPTFQVLSADVVLIGDYNGEEGDVNPANGSLLLIFDGTGGTGLDDGAAEEVEEERHFVVFNWFEELKARMGQGR
jgi:serine/threonine-protein kinase